MDGQSSSSRVLHSQARNIIYNVSKYFTLEKQHGSPVTNVARALLRTAEATKVSNKAIVERICKTARDTDELLGEAVFEIKKRKRSKTVTDLDDFDKCVLRRTILRFYERKEFPTIDKVLLEMKENIGLTGCRESLRSIMKEIGFRYAKVNG